MGAPRKNVDVTWLQEWTPALAWWLGVFYGDGNLFKSNRGHRISVCGSLSTVTRWLAIMGYGRKPFEFKRSPGVYQGYLDSVFAVEEMGRRFGFTGPKTFTLEWPKELPAELYVHFIRGLWDSDGCLSISAPRSKWVPEFKASYTSVTLSFVEKLRTVLVVGLGAPEVMVHCGSSGFTKADGSAPSVAATLAFGGSSALHVARLLYKDSPEHLRNEDRYLKYQEMERIWAARVVICTKCGQPSERMMEGLCRECWYAQRPHIIGEGTLCTECQKKPVAAQGLCTACYNRKRRASPDYERKSTGTCACGKAAYRLQLCDACYSRKRRDSQGIPAVPQRRNKSSLKPVS